MRYLTLLIAGLILTSCSSLKIEGVKDNKKSYKRLWSKSLDPVYNSGNLPIALNSPLIKDGIVYNGSNTGQMVAYDLKSGRVIWSKEDNSRYHAGIIFHKGNVLYGTVEGLVYSRHFLTGKAKYIVNLGAPVETTPTYYNGRVFYHLRNHKIVSMDALTGKILWSYKRSIPIFTTLQRASRPLIHKNKLFVGFADGHIGAFSVDDGAMLWERKISTGSKFVDIDTTPVIFNDKLYVGRLSGNLEILNYQTGSLIHSLPYSVSRAPVVKGKDRLLVPTNDGRVIELDKLNVSIRDLKLDDKGISSIKSFKDNYLVSSLSGRIHILDKSFKVLDSVYLGHRFSSVYGSIAVDENYWAVMSSRNRLYLFE